MAVPTHPLTPEHLPFFVTGPGQTDMMLVHVGIFIVGAVLLVGVFYLHLHSLPDRLAHRANSTQLQFVGILTLLALFTHNNLYWVAALLLVAVQFPDFVTPLNSIARSLEKATGRPSESADTAERADHV
ncbi:MAG: hypothetical protein KDA50_12745 [Rhodobacteraceae bacterium]|nr:hypothetical protein [Paracoccaceae bacterium]